MMRIVMAALCATLVISAKAEPDPPKAYILVSFEIEAEKFARNLPDQAAARAELARTIAAELALRYPYADWVVGPPAAHPPIGRVSARLVQTSGVPAPVIWVSWWAGAGDGALVEVPIPPVEIYSSGVIDRETNNKAAFVSYVGQRVTPVLRSDGFQQKFLDSFVREVPIASAAEMRSADHVVIIPRLWRDLRLGQESKLVVVFKRPVGAAHEEGMLRLTLPSPRTSDPKLGWLQAGVQDASIGPQTLQLNAGWHDRFATLLDGARVACYIRDYRPIAFPGTAGAVTLTSD
jgi:hypothetical protein